MNPEIRNLAIIRPSNANVISYTGPWPRPRRQVRQHPSKEACFAGAGEEPQGTVVRRRAAADREMPHQGATPPLFDHKAPIVTCRAHGKQKRLEREVVRVVDQRRFPSFSLAQDPFNRLRSARDLGSFRVFDPNSDAGVQSRAAAQKREGDCPESSVLARESNSISKHRVPVGFVPAVR